MAITGNSFLYVFSNPEMNASDSTYEYANDLVGIISTGVKANNSLNCQHLAASP